jgi:hypothetical protein
MGEEKIVEVKKTAYAQFGTALLKYVLGPVIVALGIGSYSHDNHQQSSAGYEVLAKAMNHEVMDKLEALETRVVKLEARVALQPASAPATQPAAKPPKPPIVVKVLPAKAPPIAKAPPAAKAPIRVPAKMDLKRAPMPASAPTIHKEAPRPPAMKRVPAQLNQVKL